jgi:hypothetical protein
MWAGEPDSTLRARVLARLAKTLQSSPDADRRAQLGRAAVAMARRLGDPATLSAVLYEHHMATWGPDNLKERLATAAEVVRLAEAGGDQVMALKGRGFLLADQLEQGDRPALERGLERYDQAARELGQLHFAWHPRCSGPASSCCVASSARPTGWPQRRWPWDGGPMTRWSASTT